MSKTIIERFMEKNNYKCDFIKDFNGFYKATHEDGTIIKCGTLKGLKEMIEKDRFSRIKTDKEKGRKAYRLYCNDNYCENCDYNPMTCENEFIRDFNN